MAKLITMKNKKIEEKPIHTFNDLKKEERHNILRLYDFLTYSLRVEIKKRPWEFIILFFIALVGTTIFSGILISLITGGINIRYSTPSFSLSNFSLPNMLGAEISTGSKTLGYSLDPLVLLEKIRTGNNDYLLIDIRTIKEYENGHIKTALSMPVYGTDLVNDDGNVESGRIKKAVNGKFGNKDMVIVYGHSQHSELSKKVADSIGGKGVALGVGWNEWAHFKQFWVPENKWDEVDLNDYIQVREE